MTYSLSQKSLDKLKGVDDKLVRLVKRAIEITTQDFTVLEGVRSKERQQELFNAGKSQTLNSKHLIGHAVDLGVLKNGQVTWDKEAYQKLAVCVKQAASELNINIRWGGDFHSFYDGPHFELV
jgi:peptidoglycan L-alanyl-D-glutamate endopeptidase CwlK